jgi:hypothetical protein
MGRELLTVIFSIFNLAVPMFIAWGVSVAIGTAIQFKVTAKNVDSKSNLTDFCNCCKKPQPDY